MAKTIKILGAGPSGLTAAINLAKAGFDVHVYEQTKDVGFRFHGDMQGLENWSKKINILDDIKKMNVEVNFDCDPFDQITISNGKDNRVSNCEKSAFYLVKRGSIKGSLDQGLKKQAEKAGAKIHFNKTLPEKEADIVATGPNMKQIAAMATGIIFKTKSKDIAVALLNPAAEVKGYAYLLISNGYGCLCTAIFDEFERLHDCYENAKEMLTKQFKCDIQDPKHVGGVGHFSLKNTFKKGRQLYVGEAAGLQDFLWGFGIRTAITSGYLAAKSIIENTDYVHLAKKEFTNAQKAGIANRYLWEMWGGEKFLKVTKKFRMPRRPLKRLHSFFNFNILQRLLYPVALRAMRKRYPDLEI